MSDRQQLRKQGEALQAELFGESSACDHHDLAQLQHEFSYGRIWSRPGLSRRDRMIATLAALCVRQNLRVLKRYIGAALDLGLSPQSIDEILIQCGIYVGFNTASEDCLDLSARVYEERGLTRPAGAPREDSLAELSRRGNVLADRLHGARRFEGHAAADSPLCANFYPNIVDYCYGEIWQRPGLDTRERAICALAGFTALAYVGLASKFAKASLNVGLTEGEVIEVIVQTAPYAGLAPVLQVLAAAGIRT